MKRIVQLSPPKVQNKTLSAIAGMVIVDDDMYVLASKSQDGVTKQPCVLHKLFNYLSDGGKSSCSVIQTEKGSSSIAIHANSLTYYNHVFYMVTRNRDGNQILTFGSNGIIKDRYRYSSLIATINHYDKKRFIISVNGGLSVKYRMIEISDGIKEVGVEFKVIIPEVEYQTGNDSFYDKKTKRLYVTKFKDEVSNAVFVYDLSKLTNGGKYHPIDTLYYEGTEKFEIEGLSYYDGMIACVNGVKNGKQDDFVCYL